MTAISVPCAAASRSTAPRRRQQSGSTRHDAVAIDLHLSQRPASLPALSRHRPSSHHCAALYSRRTTNLVVLPADRSFTPTHATMLRRKPIAATASIQPQQARTCGKIPIAHAAPPTLTSRDFVPWRFSDAGRRSAWIASSCRHPKICTLYQPSEGLTLF
jgi:hypothetical protein